MNPPPPPPPRPFPNTPPPPPPKRAEALFAAILDLPSPEDRERALTTACAGDDALAAEVRALLAAHEAAGDFMKATTPLPSEVEAELARLKPEEAGDRIGPYKLLQQIGEGGFGVVWMAEQEQPVRRRVALKIIKLGMDTKEVVARFGQERQALAMMDHPNIAKVFDAGATPTGRPFFVMELVRGIRITDYCDQANLPTADRLQLFIAVCHAVQHAHQKGIIHRDLKPSNILVTLHDGVPVPKVIDFGVAKATQQRLTDLTLFTQFEQMIGTPLYMSPEQAEMSGLDIDTRTDIYALGVLLYELLTGRTPFDPAALMRRGLDEIRRVIREEEPPRPSTALSTMAADAMTAVAQHRHCESAKLLGLLRGDLDWIVMKAIEKDRTRRYDTANAFAEDIQRHLTNEAVMARPPSRLYRFQKSFRRNKLAFGAASAVVLALLAGIAVSSWQAVRATRAEELAKMRVIEVAAERDAKEKARRDAEAISIFLGEVFKSPDPSRDGRTITVAETLDRAVKKLETDLASQPERRAMLQTTIGTTYYALGLYRDAIALFERGRGYDLATLGPEHPGTLNTMSWLAQSYYRAGRLDEALNTSVEVLALRRKALGPEHPDTLAAMVNVADFYFAAGRLEEALKMSVEVLALYRKVFGPEDPSTITAMGNLASSYYIGGLQDKSLKMREEVLALRRKVRGPEHPDTLAAMNDLASSYGTAGRRDEALKMHIEVLAHYRKVLGPEHPATLVAMFNLASSYYDAGRQDESLKMREEALALRRKVLGPEHPDTLNDIEGMANYYYDAGRRDEALKLREEVLAIKRKVLGPQHPGTLTAMSYLANSYGDAGRLDEALPLWAESSAHLPKDTMLALKIAALQAWFGKDADHTATSRRMLELAAGIDDASTAERAARAYCLRPSSDPQLLESAVTLARHAVELGKDHPYLQWYQMALGIAEYRHGNFPTADHALSAAEKAGKDNHHVQVITRLFRAMSLFRQGKEAEARQLFAEAGAQMEPLPADENQPLANGANANNVTAWLAYKEAKALLQAKAPALPTKSGGK